MLNLSNKNNIKLYFNHLIFHCLQKNIMQHLLHFTFIFSCFNKMIEIYQIVVNQHITMRKYDESFKSKSPKETYSKSTW